MPDPRTTPLHERHEALGASFTDFGGWLMPVRYGSDLAEHRAVREAAGLFDISHMAEFGVTGPGAAPFLDYALAGRLSALDVDQARYSLVLAPDGGILDDVIAYRLADDRFVVIANAGNRAAVAGALTQRARGFDAVVTDETDTTALIAVQGPRATDVLAATPGLGSFSVPLSAQKYYRAAHALFTPPEGAEVDVLIARTGYTGEDGFEIVVPAAAAVALWDALLAAGEPSGLVPAGLAARDTLRLEAGMPLYGHELSRSIRPAQAGLGRAVAADKSDFVGKGAPADPDARVLVGLVSEGRRAARAGYAVYDGDRAVGEVTSGALSPTLGHPIAMAFVDSSVSAPGTGLSLDVRGSRIPATVTPLPFYRRNP